MAQTNPNGPTLQHLALMVRDIEASHRFYTEVIGFEQCGALHDDAVDFRFYRGAPDRHHDLALVQLPDPSVFPPANPRWKMLENKLGINHVAICYPDREAFLERLAIIADHGVAFRQRGNHGMTHSAYIADPDGNGVEVLYELPESAWIGDVDAALNFWQPLPTTGDEALADVPAPSTDAAASAAVRPAVVAAGPTAVGAPKR